MFKVAILGCENSHANSFLKTVLEQKVCDDIEFVGVYSDDMEAAQKLHDQFGVAVAQSYDEFVGKVDAIVYTGGMAYSEKFCEEISSYVSRIAPIIRLPGEEEMRALAEGALRALHNGDCKEYK